MAAPRGNYLVQHVRAADMMDDAPESTIAFPVMLAAPYEAERPSEALACRSGDERLLVGKNWQAPVDHDGE